MTPPDRFVSEIPHQSAQEEARDRANLFVRGLSIEQRRQLWLTLNPEEAVPPRVDLLRAILVDELVVAAIPENRAGRTDL